MPVACVLAGKGGCYSFERQPGLNGRCVVDVQIVVEINEVIMNCLTEYGETKPGKKEVYTDSDTAPVNATW
jgi:hypothetical protein